MTPGLINDLIREALWVCFLVASPVLGTALVVGVAIGLFQALTSIQEMTLTFAPKLIAIAVVFWMSVGLTGKYLVDFYQNRVLELVVGG